MVTVRDLLLYTCAIGLAVTEAAAQSPLQRKQTDVSGTWFGEFVLTSPDAKVSHDTAVLILEQHGSDLAGTVGPTVDQQSQFTNGRVENGRVEFHLDSGGGMEFQLQRVGERLQGAAIGKNVRAELSVVPAPGLLPHPKLLEEIAQADKETFDAFGSCVINRYASRLSEDLEFYQDRTGESGYEDNLQRLRDRCAEGIQLRREIAEGSLIVNAVPGYGAIEAGVQRFYSRQQDGSEHLDATVKFTMLWSKKTGTWKLTRIISYDHR